MTDHAQKSLENMFSTCRHLPVTTVNDAASAADLARALLAGGINNIEITLRTPASLAAIKNITSSISGITVGAGTVFSAEQLNAAADAGAKYIVSPGYSATVDAAARARNVPYLPGAVTPTEIQTLMEKGFRYLKFFPAEAAGGVKMLSSLAPVFASMKFCATGGISEENAASYLALPNVIAVGMSSLTPSKLVDAKDWTGITALAQKITRSSGVSA